MLVMIRILREKSQVKIYEMLHEKKNKRGKRETAAASAASVASAASAATAATAAVVKVEKGISSRMDDMPLKRGFRALSRRYNQLAEPSDSEASNLGDNIRSVCFV